MNADKVFVDTNILVYALDADQPAKRGVSLELIERLGTAGCMVLSTQVIQETYSAATRKLKIEPRLVEKALNALFGHPVVTLDLALIQRGMRRHQDDQLAFYDALIVESALAAECSVLASEDFQSGRQFESLRVTNPFEESIA
ncbi:MAG: PIN domain-containing protein [Pseudomonadota bacterium]|jgi:predicted nucleic acid-binding protein